MGSLSTTRVTESDQELKEVPADKFATLLETGLVGPILDTINRAMPSEHETSSALDSSSRAPDQNQAERLRRT